MSKKTTKNETSQKHQQEEGRVVIEPPKIGRAQVTIEGESPLVVHRFGSKARKAMEKTLANEGGKGKKKEHEKRDHEADMRDALHIAEDGWYGMPAAAFRSAMITACKVSNYHMTKAKLSLFVEHDGMSEEGIPLVRIEGGEPELHITHVRIAKNSTDLRARPMWKRWSITLRLRWDAGQFELSDVVNLLVRAGLQVGIGEGRANSTTESGGMGWGHFRVKKG